MAAGVVAAKKQLRKELKRALAAMTKEQMQDQSAILTEKVLATELYRSSKRLSIYLSMPAEVDTQHILEDAFRTGKECFVPRYEGPEMDMLRVHSMVDVAGLPLTPWNIPQPASVEGRENPLTSGHGLDLILVPGLGFTEGGLRIGRGKGYYDAYIAKCFAAGHSPKLLGLAFLCQRCTHIPTTSEDLPIDKVLFPDSAT